MRRFANELTSVDTASYSLRGRILFAVMQGVCGTCNELCNAVAHGLKFNGAVTLTALERDVRTNDTHTVRRPSRLRVGR
jgi:hypothetical protein